MSDELETIRQRWADHHWLYSEDWEGEHCASAGIFAAGRAPDGSEDDGPWLLDIEEPSAAERETMERCAAAPDDVRTLLARLEQAEAGAAVKTNALCDIAAMCQSLLDQDDIIDADWVVQCAVAALTTDAGAALLAELTQLRIDNDTLRSIIRGAGEQLGQGEIPLAVAIARLRSEALAARRLADAIAEHRGCLVDDAALDVALERYQKARKGGTDAEQP